MSLALIQESAKEARRLAIAGSPLAVGDFRLKKLVAPLEQAGAKVPVFAQVAKAITELVDGKEAASSTNLLNLSTLLNAILYTQGQTSATGDLAKLEIFSASCTSTRTPARQLKPVIAALSASGGGRLEVIKSALERGVFNDLRLIDPAICALGDGYPEIADLVAEKILPGYGPGIVPRLKLAFDLKGKRQEARALEVMHQLDPAATLDLCKKALEEGSADVKVAAIGCLGKHEEFLPLVLEQTTAKNKEVRAAALEAAAGYDRPEITKIFTDLIKGKALDLLIGPFRALQSREVLEALLAEGRRVFDVALKGDSEVLPRLGEIFNCLVHRKETDVETFLTNCLANSDKLAKVKAPKNSVISGADLVFDIAGGLYKIGSPKALEALLAKRDALPSNAFSLVIRSALRTWSPEKVFTEFAPLLEQTKGAAKERNEQLQRFIEIVFWDGRAEYDPLDYDELDSDSDRAFRKVKWDERWLDAAIKADLPTLVCSLARPNHKGVVTYLLKLADTKKTTESGSIVRALARCQYPKVTDFFIELVTKKVKKAKQYDYELQDLIQNARHLPPADLPKLDEFAAKLEEKYVDTFLVAIDPLRRPKETT